MLNPKLLLGIASRSRCRDSTAALSWENQLGKVFSANNEDRSPHLSPRGSNNYNRFKYYSALKTGYQHLSLQEENDFLSIPHHVIDEQIFVPDFTMHRSITLFLKRFLYRERRQAWLADDDFFCVECYGWHWYADNPLGLQSFRTASWSRHYLPLLPS